MDTKNSLNSVKTNLPLPKGNKLKILVKLKQLTQLTQLSINLIKIRKNNKWNNNK